MAGGLALVGPFDPHALRDLIPPATWRDDLPGSVGSTVVPALARAMISRGTRVTIVSYAPGLDREIIVDAAPLRLCIGPGRLRGRARDFFAVERNYLRSALLREQPALIHAHWTYEFALAGQATGLPCLVTAHDAPLTILRHNPSPYRFMRTLMASAVLRRAEEVIAVSPHVEHHLRRWIGYRGECTVIPNGIEESVFRAAPIRTRTPPVFACVINGWGRLKNPTTLLQAFARLRLEIPQSRLLAIGQDYGPGGPAAQWANSHAVADGVDFIGPLPHDLVLERLRNSVDILVHPSLEESQGMVIVEAMAAGLPVIGGIESGAVPWVLDHGAAGLLTDVSSVSALSAAMLALARDPARREAFAARGFQHARDRFGMSAVAERHAKIYDTLCGSTWRQPG